MKGRPSLLIYKGTGHFQREYRTMKHAKVMLRAIVAVFLALGGGGQLTASGESETQR